jgi:hypothetical protein
MLFRHAQFRRTAALAAVVTCIALTTTTAPAMGAQQSAARPVRIGAVTGLDADVVKPGAAYLIDSTWNAATNAAGYKVKLVNAAGKTLSSDSVSALSWTTRTTVPAGTTVKVVVTAFNGTRKGRSATWSTVLPDLTAPTGAYDVTYDTAVSTVATVTETALSDDVSAPAAIARSIDWGEQEGVDSWEPWTSGTVLTHEYPATLGVRYQPRVRVEDAAGNTATLPLRGVVIGDENAPTGTFTATPLNPWAKLNKVTLTQTALEDNFTPNANIERLVDWGDGTPTVIWSSGTVLQHLYTTGGSYTPTVTLADEAFNQVAVAANGVTVRVDSVKPTVRLRLPSARKAVKSWLTLRGRALDGLGTGVKSVEVRAVQKRGTVWYAFRPALGTWTKAGSTRTAAFSKAGLRRVAPTSTGAFSARLPRLRRGVLVVRLAAVDRVGNRSATASYRQALTRY